MTSKKDGPSRLSVQPGKHSRLSNLKKGQTLSSDSVEYGLMLDELREEMLQKHDELNTLILTQVADLKQDGKSM